MLSADGWLHSALDASQVLVAGLELLGAATTDPLALKQLENLKKRAIDQGELLHKVRRSYGISILHNSLVQ